MKKLFVPYYTIKPVTLVLTQHDKICYSSNYCTYCNVLPFGKFFSAFTVFSSYGVACGNNENDYPNRLPTTTLTQTATRTPQQHPQQHEQQPQH